MIQQTITFVKNTYRVYKEEIPSLLYVLMMLKFSMRWNDSVIGYVFFPVMLYLFMRMNLNQRLYVLVAFLPFGESQQLPRGMFGVTGLNPVNVAFLGVLFPMLIRKDIKWKHSSYNMAIFAFIFLNFFSAFRGMGAMKYLGISSSLKYFLESFLKPMQLFLCGIMAFNIFKKPKEVDHFIRFVKLSSLMLGLWVISRGGGTLESMRRLALVTGLHKNSVGFMFAVLLAMNLATRNFGSAFEKLLSKILSIIYIMVIMFTFSRQGYVTCAFLLFIYSIKKGWKSAVIFAVSVTLFWFFFMPYEVKKRIYYGSEKGVMMGFKDYTLGDTTAGRQEAWSKAIEIFNQNPLFGEGRYTYLKYVKYYRPDLPVHPHSAYLQCFLDNGIFFGVFILGFYVFLIFKSWFLYKKSKSKFASDYAYGFMLCIVVFLLQGYTGFRFYPNEESIYIWLFLGVLMWIDRNEKYLAEQERLSEGAIAFEERSDVPRPSLGSFRSPGSSR